MVESEAAVLKHSAGGIATRIACDEVACGKTALGFNKKKPHPIPTGCDYKLLNPLTDINRIRDLVPTWSPDQHFVSTPPT